MKLNESERTRLLCLYRIQARGNFWDGPNHWWAPGNFARNARQTGLVRKGLLEESLAHGYSYRLTSLGRKIAEELLAQGGN